MNDFPHGDYKALIFNTQNSRIFSINFTISEQSNKYTATTDELEIETKLVYTSSSELSCAQKSSTTMSGKTSRCGIRMVGWLAGMVLIDRY